MSSRWCSGEVSYDLAPSSFDVAPSDSSSAFDNELEPSSVESDRTHTSSASSPSLVPNSLFSSVNPIAPRTLIVIQMLEQLMRGYSIFLPPPSTHITHLTFLVACFATQHPALSVRPSVGRSLHPSVTLYFLALMGVLALLLRPKCSTDLNYGPCPPARDWGSRVSGLVDYLV